jgi:hypothetical protein
MAGLGVSRGLVVVAHDCPLAGGVILPQLAVICRKVVLEYQRNPNWRNLELAKMVWRR